MVCHWLQTQGYCKLDHTPLKHLLDTGGQVNIPPALKQHEDREKPLLLFFYMNKAEPDKLSLDLIWVDEVDVKHEGSA